MGRNKRRGHLQKKVSMVALGKQLILDQRKIKQTELIKERKEKEAADRVLKAQLDRFRWSYNETQQILLVGEGNCSFARALVRRFKSNLVAYLEKKGYPIPEDPYVINKNRYEDMNEEDFEEDFEEEDFEEDAEEDVEDGNEEQEITAQDFDADGNFIMKRCPFNFGNIAKNLIVTCYDTQEVAMQKYDDLPEILAEILAAGARVIFGIDATTLHATLTHHELIPESRFDRVVFNFPHVGLGIVNVRENIEANQRLILSFLANSVSLLKKPFNDTSADIPTEEDAVEVKKDNKYDYTKDMEVEEDDDEEDDSLLLDEDKYYCVAYSRYLNRQDRLIGGQVHITIKDGAPYDAWKLPVIARTFNINQIHTQKEKEQLKKVGEGAYETRFPKLKLCSKKPFFSQFYDGYQHRRTLGFKEGVSQPNNEEIGKGAKTYTFSRAPKGYVDHSLGLGGDKDAIAGNNSKLNSNAPKQKKMKSGRTLLRGKRNKVNRVK